MERRQLCYDFMPLVFFFIGYQCAGIYWATGMTMVTAFLLFLMAYWLKDDLSISQKMSFILIIIFGGATLFFHNPHFIKWKPTLLYWGMALGISYTLFFQDHCAMERLLKPQCHLPKAKWRSLSFSALAFFIGMGALNLYIAENFSTDLWVKYKVIGTIAMTLLFSIFCAAFISKHQSSS